MKNHNFLVMVRVPIPIKVLNEGQEAMVQWLRQTAHDQEVLSLNPGNVYWVDVSNATHRYMKITKSKVAEWGTPEKKYFYASADRMGPLKPL